METMTFQPAKVLYTAKTHTTGNRENGISRSDDGNLDLRTALPGSGKPGTNPEQLFAATNICPYSKAIKGNVDVEYNLN